MFAKKNIRKQYLFYLRNFLSAAKLLLLLQQVGTEGGGKVAGSRRERILILCKPYPSPRGKHSETSSVAGMTEEGSLIRLFPVERKGVVLGKSVAVSVELCGPRHINNKTNCER